MWQNLLHDTKYKVFYQTFHCNLIFLGHNTDVKFFQFQTRNLLSYGHRIKSFLSSTMVENGVGTDPRMDANIYLVVSFHTPRPMSSSDGDSSMDVAAVVIVIALI